MKHGHAFNRRDGNHGEIVKAYEALFCSVVDTSKIGGGFPDLVVGIAGRMFSVEIKTEEGELGASQKRFQATWRGPKVVVVRTVEDVFAHVKKVREWVALGAPLI